MPNDRAGNIVGGCYCEAVRFSIPAGTQPVWAGYCHCRDCRKAHAATLYQAVYVEEAAFFITGGTELLRWYTRMESRRVHYQRYFCVQCGTKVFSKLETVKDGQDVKWIGTFPSLFEDQELALSGTWRPWQHIFSGESILDLSLLHDQLPKHLGGATFDKID